MWMNNFKKELYNFVGKFVHLIQVQFPQCFRKEFVVKDSDAGCIRENQVNTKYYRIICDIQLYKLLFLLSISHSFEYIKPKWCRAVEGKRKNINQTQVSIYIGMYDANFRWNPSFNSCLFNLCDITFGSTLVQTQDLNLASSSCGHSNENTIYKILLTKHFSNNINLLVCLSKNIIVHTNCNCDGGQISLAIKAIL